MPRRVSELSRGGCDCKSTSIETESSDSTLSSDSNRSDDGATSERHGSCMDCGQCGGDKSDSSSDNSDEESHKLPFNAREYLGMMSSDLGCGGRKSKPVDATAEAPSVSGDPAAGASAVRNATAARENGAVAPPSNDNDHVPVAEASSIKSEQLDAAVDVPEATVSAAVVNEAVEQNASVNTATGVQEAALPAPQRSTASSAPPSDSLAAVVSITEDQIVGESSTHPSSSLERRQSLKRHAKSGSLVNQHELKKQKLKLESLKLALELGILTREDCLEKGRRVIGEETR